MKEKKRNGKDLHIDKTAARPTTKSSPSAGRCGVRQLMDEMKR